MGKMLQTDRELDSLSWHKNNMLVQDSCAYSGEKARSNMPVTIPIPSAQGALKGRGLEEGLHLSLNNYLVDAQVYNKKSIHQIGNHLPYSMPFEDGTSKVPLLNWKDSDTNVFGGQNIPSKNPTGKGVHEINGARTVQKTIEAVDQLGFMKRYSEQTVEVSEQGTLDDIPMEIVELLAKNQYERCLPDVENRSSTLEKPSWKESTDDRWFYCTQKRGDELVKRQPKGENLREDIRKNMVTRGENVKPSKRKPDDEASRIWASLTSNSQGYDFPKKVVSSQHPSSSVDITSLQSGAFHKQNMKRDIDLNYMNLNAAGLEKLSRNSSSETFNRMNGEYSFPCKHSGMEPHQNLRGSLDLYSNETIPAMHLLSLMDAGMQSRTAFDVGRSFLPDKHGCFAGSPTFGASSSTPHDKKLIRATAFNGQNPMKSGRKEKMKSSNSTLQNKVSKQICWPRNETETSLQRKLEVNGNHETPVPYKIISGNTCMVNRNPADLTIPETGNIYMIRGEDLKFEKNFPKTGLASPFHMDQSSRRI
ncbi:hypothetical protein JHK87_055239 [Glycine soja]|nr:hypothetical protein JHK87_055239 [Glycine soja]